MLKIPLTVQTKEEGKELRSTILCNLGDNIYQRHPERYDDVDVPEPLASSGVLGQPTRSHRSTFGSILTFRKEHSFAMLSLNYNPGENISYRLSAHAGWQNAGTVEHLEKYHRAFDILLDRLGVLADSYKFTCPCGDEHVFRGGYAALAEYVNKHANEEHGDGRTPTSTLIGREVTMNTASEQPLSSEQQEATN